MARTLLRLPDELFEKIRWLSYKEKRSQNTVMVEILQAALKDVEIPEEALS